MFSIIFLINFACNLAARTARTFTINFLFRFQLFSCLEISAFWYSHNLFAARHKRTTQPTPKTFTAMINAFLCEFNYFALIANIFLGFSAALFQLLAQSWFAFFLYTKKVSFNKYSTIFLLSRASDFSFRSFLCYFFHNIISKHEQKFKLIAEQFTSLSER